MGVSIMRVAALIWQLLPERIWLPVVSHHWALQHVELVERTANGTWLFRTGGPYTFRDGVFGAVTVDLPPLYAALRRASLHAPLSAHGVDRGEGPSTKLTPGPVLPQEVRFVDINLLSNEKGLIKAETDFFDDNPSLGSFINWPLDGLSPTHILKACDNASVSGSNAQVEATGPVGGLVSTSDQILAVCRDLRSSGFASTLQPRDAGAHRHKLAASFQQWDTDHLVVHVEELHRLVHRDELHPRAIFFHCVCGCDRTGQMFAAYAITHLNWTLQEALEHNSKVIGRPMLYENQISVQWYCEWLHSRGRYPHNDCGHCGGIVPCADPGYIVDPFMPWLELYVAVTFVLLAVAAICSVLLATKFCRTRAMGIKLSTATSESCLHEATTAKLTLPLLTDTEMCKQAQHLAASKMQFSPGSCSTSASGQPFDDSELSA